MLYIEISTVDPGIVFLSITYKDSNLKDMLLFANEVPARKVQAIIGEYMREYVLE